MAISLVTPLSIYVYRKLSQRVFNVSKEFFSKALIILLKPRLFISLLRPNVNLNDSKVLLVSNNLPISRQESLSKALLYQKWIETFLYFGFPNKHLAKVFTPSFVISQKDAYNVKSSIL